MSNISNSLDLSKNLVCPIWFILGDNWKYCPVFWKTCHLQNFFSRINAGNWTESRKSSDASLFDWHKCCFLQFIVYSFLFSQLPLLSQPHLMWKTDKRKQAASTKLEGKQSLFWQLFSFLQYLTVWSFHSHSRLLTGLEVIYRMQSKFLCVLFVHSFAVSVIVREKTTDCTGRTLTMRHSNQLFVCNFPLNSLSGSPPLSFSLTSLSSCLKNSHVPFVSSSLTVIKNHKCWFPQWKLYVHNIKDD